MAKKYIPKDSVIQKVELLSQVQLITGVFDHALLFVEEKGTIYEFTSNSSEIIDDDKILPSPYSGNTRWIGIAGSSNFYGSNTKPMLIVLSNSDFPSPDYTYRIPEAYGQTYVVQLTLDIPTYIIFPYNIDARGNSFSLYYISSTHDIYLQDYEQEWGDDLLDNNTIRTFIATNSTVAGSRWNEREIYHVIDDAAQLLSKLWINNEPNSTTFKPHVFIGGSESRLLQVSAVQGLEDYTNTYVFRNTTPYTMTLPTATSNYGRVLRFYRDGAGLITIQRSGSDTFGRDLTSITLNDKQYVEMIAANNNQWLITAQSNLSGQQVATVTSGNLTPSRYIDTVLCTNTTTSTIIPDATLGIGKLFTIKRLGTGSVTIDPTSTQTIDGLSTYTLANINDSITMQSDGSNWNVISKNIGSVIQTVSTSTTINATTTHVESNGSTGNLDLTLPVLTNIPNGHVLTIKNINNAQTTIIPNGTDTIDYLTTSVVIGSKYDSIELLKNGTNWQILNKYIDSEYIINQASSGSITLYPHHSIVVFNSTDPISATLPLASTVKIGKEFFFKKINTGNVSIGRSGSDTIDGVGASISIQQQWDSCTIKCISSTAWAVVSKEEKKGLLYTYPSMSDRVNMTGHDIYGLLYNRNGSMVTVHGRVDVQTTIAGLASFKFTLPISAVLGADDDLSGHGTTVSGGGMVISPDTTNNLAKFDFTGDGTMQTWYFSFMYIL